MNRLFLVIFAIIACLVSPVFAAQPERVAGNDFVLQLEEDLQMETSVSSPLDKDGSPMIDESDFPEIDLYRDGTGRFWFSAEIPLVAPFPVIVLVKRCAECPFYIAKAVWPQSGSDHLWEGVSWFRVEDGPDRIDFEPIGKTFISGEFQVKVAVLHYQTGIFMTKTFTFRVERMDFTINACLDTGGQTVLDVNIESIHPINQNAAFISIGQTDGVLVGLDRGANPYRASATIGLDPTVGQEFTVTVFLADRSSYKEFSFPHGFYPCGGKG